MTPDPPLSRELAQRWKIRWVVLAGGAVIAAVAVAGVYDIVKEYRQALDETGRQLESQARSLAEQTARTIDTVDIILRHAVSRYARIGVPEEVSREVHEYLATQADGVVQLDALAMQHASGKQLGASWEHPPSQHSVASHPALRGGPGEGLYVGAAERNPTDGQLVFTLSRRLDSGGKSAGTVLARLRVGYFQEFYSAIRMGLGTHLTLLREDAVMLAHYPANDSALGKPYASLAKLLSVAGEPALAPVRLRSPVDGADRIWIPHKVANYPLVVVASRELGAALSEWRSHSLGIGGRTLILSSVAILFLYLLIRKLEQLDRARESLKISEERFALAAAGADSGIWDLDIHGDSIYVSPRAQQLLGLDAGPELRSREKFLAQLRFHPDDERRRQNSLEAHFVGKAPAYGGDYRVEDGQGGYRWVRIHGLCQRDTMGKPFRMAGSIADIDAQKRAEAEVRESEARYERAMTGSNEAHWDWNLQTGEQYLSLRMRDMYGFPQGVAIDTRAKFSQHLPIHPDDRARWQAAIAGHLSGKTPRYDIEYRVVHPPGEVRWLHARGKCSLDAHGKPALFSGSSTDITDRKHAEMEKERLEVQLRQSQKLEAMGTLAGGIAHDFNNILAAILGYGELAQKEAAAGSSLKRRIDNIMNAGQRAKSLVERILAFSRSGISAQVLVHVQSAVAETLDILEASLPPRVQFERELLAGNAALMGDATQIHQVVMNLCTNAIQALKPGGMASVRLEVVKLDHPVMTTTRFISAGEYIRLSVRDSGIGIPKELLDRIFDPFFTTKEVGVGTGLGLSLVHGIVSDLRGSIDVRSNPSGGTTFVVYFPWDGSIAAPKQTDETLPAGNGQTILFVDDEEALVRVGEEMVAELGYEPAGFVSSSAALEAFRASPQRFDVVLTDETMPQMTGSELAREIRKLRSDIPIVLISGYAGPATAERARAMGANDVLAKPLASRELAGLLARLLSN
ncbi:MAG: PAS domain-containing protein [Burkholderiales bacterium]